MCFRIGDISCGWLCALLCSQSVQYAAAAFGGYGLFKEDLKLLVCQRYAFGQHTFKQPHALA